MNPFRERASEETKTELLAARNKEGLKAVCSNAQRRLDEVFARELFLSKMTIACCAGCHFCCHVKVDVQPRDIFLVADFIRSRFTSEKQAEVLRKAQENWRKIEPMTAKQHLNAVLPCPLLEDGKCTVYPVRPSSCRKAHSLRSEPCAEYLKNPESNEIFAELVADVQMATSGEYVGTSRAFEFAGYDSQPYDLNAALIQALQNPACERRWKDGKKAFPQNMLAKDWPKGMKMANLPA